MAEGGKTDKAQTPAKCEFCEESDIFWKCLNCDLFLCKLCTTKIHTKSKASQEHRIVNIKNLGTIDAAEDHRNVDLKSLTCEIHKDQKYISFCSLCNTLICVLCLTNFHQNHKLLNLDDCYNEKLLIIKRHKLDLTHNIHDLQSQKVHHEEVLKNIKDRETELRNKISDREKLFKDQVTKYTQSLLQQLTEEYHPVEVKIQDKLKEIKIFKEKASIECKAIDQILFSHKARDIIAAKSLSGVNPQEQTCNIQPPKTTFFDGPTADIQLDKFFGYLCKIPHFEVLESYETNLNRTSQICCVGAEAWIGCHQDRKLQKVALRNDKTEVITETNFDVYDFSIMQNGDLLLSLDTELDLLANNGNSQSTIKSFSPLHTLGVHVTESNKIIVGLSETSKPENGKGLLQVTNLSGDIEHTYKTENDNHRMFTWPRRIVTKSDKIFVIDLLDDSWVGRVVALNFGGYTKWTYNGTGTFKKRIFYPKGIAVTSACMLLVSDFLNDAIHILNLNGEVIVCHNVKDQGIERPWSLAFDSSGLLWVGCEKRLDKKSVKIQLLKLK